MTSSRRWRRCSRCMPLPVLLFTRSPDAERLDRAARCRRGGGGGRCLCERRRLRPLAASGAGPLSRASRRCATSSPTWSAASRSASSSIAPRAMLMRARQIPEDEAFRMLRVASMHANLRVGQVSQQVIDAARFAEAINRAGQLRMLAQQAVKHVALAAARRRAAKQDRERVAELQRHGERNLDALARSLSDATYGDLLGAVRDSWLQLQAAAGAAGAPPAAGGARRLAEQVLQQAERLTGQLEHCRSCRAVARRQSERPPAHAVAAHRQAGAARARDSSDPMPRAGRHCSPTAVRHRDRIRAARSGTRALPLGSPRHPLRPAAGAGALGRDARCIARSGSAAAQRELRRRATRCSNCSSV